MNIKYVANCFLLSLLPFNVLSGELKKIDDVSLDSFQDNKIKVFHYGENEYFMTKFYYDKKTRNYGENLNVIFHGNDMSAKDFLSSTSIHNFFKNDNFLAFNSNKNWKNEDVGGYLNKISEIYNLIDIEQIYFYGFSSGATFMNDFICENEKFFKNKSIKIISVNGSVSNNLVSSNCKFKNASYVYIYGTEDDYYSYNGKPKEIMTYNFKNSVSILREKLQCITEPSIFPINDFDPSDETKVSHYSFICSLEDKNYLNVLHVDGMGHNWINLKNSYDFNFFYGKSNYELSIPFIKKHIMK